MVDGRRRFGAIAVAAEIRGDNRKVLGRARRDPVPHDVGLAMAIEQQEQRPAPTLAHVDDGFAGIDPRQSELVE